MKKRLSAHHIRKILNFLKTSLPEKPTVVNDLYTVPSSMRSIDDLQAISDHMGFYIGLLRSIKVILCQRAKEQFIVDKSGITREQTEELKYSGLYKVIGPDHQQIEIVKDPGFYFKHYLAILAHECTHNYLYHHQINSKAFNQEAMTDIAAVFLGFGHLPLEGYEHCHWTNYYDKSKPTYSFILGYIDKWTIKKAIIRSVRLRRWRKSDLYSKVSFANRLYFKVKLLPYFFLK